MIISDIETPVAILIFLDSRPIFRIFHYTGLARKTAQPVEFKR